MSGHTCNAGVNKLVVMYDGTIIPCEAFKGLIEKFPQFNLGNIRDTTLEKAHAKALADPVLTCFQNATPTFVDLDRAAELDEKSARLMNLLKHMDNCKQCAEANLVEQLCEEGKHLHALKEEL